jgi:hypothetical protein
MSLSNAMWDIFRHTGDISAYLAYKDFLQCGTEQDYLPGDMPDEDQ